MHLLHLLLSIMRRWRRRRWWLLGLPNSFIAIAAIMDRYSRRRRRSQNTSITTNSTSSNSRGRLLLLRRGEDGVQNVGRGSLLGWGEQSEGRCRFCCCWCCHAIVAIAIVGIILLLESAVAASASAAPAHFAQPQRHEAMATAMATLSYPNIMIDS